MGPVLSGTLDQSAYNKLPCQEMCVTWVSLVHSPWFEIKKKKKNSDYLFIPVKLMIIILSISIFGAVEKVEKVLS